MMLHLHTCSASLHVLRKHCFKSMKAQYYCLFDCFISFDKARKMKTPSVVEWFSLKPNCSLSSKFGMGFPSTVLIDSCVYV